jgi:choline-sulfatase
MAHALVWGEQIRVPLIVRVPGRAAARRDENMSAIDVLPTVIDLAPGFPRDELAAQARGRSVVAEEWEARPVFSMSPSSQNEYALTLSRWKFIHRPRDHDALYDLQEDPHERVNLLDDQAGPPAAEALKRAASLKEYLVTSMKEQRERNAWLVRGGKPPKLTPEQEAKHLEALRKLGYVDGEDGGR